MMILGVLSEVAGKYAVYLNNVNGKMPHCVDHDCLVFPMDDVSLPMFDGSKFERADRTTVLYWSKAGTSQVDMYDSGFPIKPATHGSIYLFGSQRLCDFAAGYFAAYDGCDVASIYTEIAQHFQDSDLGSYSRLMPNF
jgi:hypothetical protein